MPGKELVTEQHVRAMAAGSELVLGLNRIATPSALDLAFERGIRVSYREAGDHSVLGTASDLWKRMRAQDGTYVVVVKNGRASVSRLSDTGPTAFGEE